MATKHKDLSGQIFHGLEVLRPAEVIRRNDGRRNYYYYWVECPFCHAEFRMEAKEIRRGRQKSCGCMTAKLISKAQTRHGMSGTPIWNAWHSMKERCENPSAQAWKNYGGRGIQVCPEWTESFEAFYRDMSPTYRPGLTLDRIDVNGNYCPENCRWVTAKIQGNNRRTNRLIETPWGVMTVAQASEKSGINVTTLTYRLDHGVSGDSLFAKPDVRNRFST